MLKRYIVKAGFESIDELNQAQKKLEESGFKNSDIDYISNPKIKGKGLKFSNMTKASIFATRFMPIGLIVGAIFYLYYTFSRSEEHFFNNLFSLDVYSLIFTSLLTGVVFMAVGYFWGKRSRLQVIKYSEKKSNSKSIILAFDVHEENLEKVKSILSSLDATFVDIIDTRREIELGIRSQ